MHVADCGPLRSLKSARRVASPCSPGFVSRPSKVLVHAERLSPPPLSFLLCMQANQTTAKEWERRKSKRLHLEQLNHSCCEVVARCINFHSFALAIFDDGQQRNVILSDGSYWLSTKSSSYLVSAMSNNDKFK